jgi:hypothetical protein
MVAMHGNLKTVVGEKLPACLHSCWSVSVMTRWAPWQ